MKSLRKQLAPIVVISFLIAVTLELISLIPIAVVPKIIDVYIPNRNYKYMVLSILALCGVPLIVSLGYDGYQYFIMLKSRQLVAKVNLQCFDKILHQPMEFFDENFSSELAQKASQDAVSYVAIWTIDFPKLLSNVMMGCVVFYVLWNTNILIAVIQLLYIPLSLLLMQSVGSKLEGLIIKVVESNARYKSIMQEAFHSIRLVKALTLEKIMCDEVELVQNGILKIWGKVAFYDNFVGGISNTLVPNFFYGLTFILSSILAANKVFSVGYLTAVLSYATKIHNMFTNLIKTYNSFKKARGESYVIEQYLQLKDERCVNGQVLWKMDKMIEFKDISFRYPATEKNVLEHVSMKVQKGKWVGIIGSSGVGKSTILELLLRFYDSNGGEIFIDDKPIEDINVFDLRDHISYVTQNPILLEGSIRDNLRLAKPNASEEELEKVAKKTGIINMIQDGLDKEVGENGELLSGGEKQRVAIARCLLEEKEVWLLDEVTSQLDTATQDEILEIIKEDHDDRHTTIISIAHRMEFNQYTDEVICLN